MKSCHAQAILHASLLNVTETQRLVNAVLKNMLDKNNTSLSQNCVLT